MKKTPSTAIFGVLAMLMLILDSQTAMSSAKVGVELCIQVIIPSLFPFFILSGIISSTMLGRKIKFLRPVGKLCRIPEGSESLLLLGFLAGYPAGAQMIISADQQGALSRKDTERMLGFCCNAGPAFLFGMLSPLFSEKWMLWVLWLIHILSALITGVVLPGGRRDTVRITATPSLSLADSMVKSVKTMGLVCGWVVVFRVILGFGQKLLLCVLPSELQVMISGLLEISNGCVRLSGLRLEGMRFLFAGIFLSAGGLCVWMQTKSVTGDIGTGMYLPGKVLQILITTILSICLQGVFPRESGIAVPYIILLPLGCIFVIFVCMLYRKLGMEKAEKLLYNKDNQSAKESLYVVS